MAHAGARAFVWLFGVPEIGAHVRIREAIRLLPPRLGSLIDIGCGPGMMLGAVARHTRPARIVGIELDARASEIASRTHPGATIVNDDFLTWGGSETFDAATCVDVLEHVPTQSLAPFVARMHDVLRPGGTLVIHVPATPQRRHFRRFNSWGHHDHEREGFTSEGLTTLLNDAGFRDVVVKRTFGYWGSLAWELNMMVAGKLLQAFVFPVALALSYGDRLSPIRNNNGWLAFARRSAGMHEDILV